MSKDLQGFIAQEEKTCPGSVIRVQDRIDPNKFETIAFLKLLDTKGFQKIVLFENVLTLQGQPSPFSLFYNPFITRQFCADALGMGELKTDMELGIEFAKREVMWAVGTRTHWDKDLEVIRKVQSVRDWLGDSVALIDATRPQTGDFPKKNEVPEDAMKRVDISKYV